MLNANNLFYQNSMINARKDNDEWKNAAETCSPNLIEKSITENGDYSAKTDGADGYSSVTVNVSNSYTSDDNGKVVSEQQLVAQTAYPTTVTQNDTYDTTNYNSITVEVPSGSEAFEVIVEIDPNTYYITSISETFADTLQKINNGDYVKIMLKQSEAEPSISAGYCVLLNGTTHEYDGILIFLAGGYANGMIVTQGYKWNSDDTYVNDVMLVQEPTT